MSTLTSGSSHAAVAALIVAATAVQSQEQKLLNEAIDNVSQRCTHLKLSQSTIDQFKSCQSGEDFLRVFDNIRSASKLLRSIEKGSRQERILKFANHVLFFKDYGNAMAQLNQGIVAPIWGAICATLMVAQNVQKTSELLDQICVRLKRWSDRFGRLYNSGDALTPNLYSELLNFHETAVQFSFSVAAVLEKSAPKTFFASGGSQLSDELKIFLQNLTESARDVDGSVTIESYLLGFEKWKQAQLTPVALATPAPISNLTSSTSVAGPAQPMMTRKYHVPNNLSPCFSGRSEELRAIYTSLNTNSKTDVPSVTVIQGIAGVGKSQTALRFAEDNKTANPAGVYTSILFVRANTKPTLLTEFCELARDLRIIKADGQLAQKHKHTVLSAVKDWLATNPNWLFIFDNVTDSSDVLEYIPTSGNGHVLFTTKNSLAAERLAPIQKVVEIRPMHPETTGLELVLHLAPYGTPCTPQNEASARKIASFAHGLPLIIEQIVNFGKYSDIGWDKVLDIMTNRMDLLKQHAAGSYHEEQFSAWAVLDTVLKHLEQNSPKTAELFKILVFLDCTSIPLVLLHEARNNINKFLQRNTTYDRGFRDSSSRTAQVQARMMNERSKQPDDRWFSSAKKKLQLTWRRGNFSQLGADSSPFRVDSGSDLEMQELWASSERLIQKVFEDTANLDNAINVLEKVGVLRKFDTTCLWIHDLFAQMGRALISQESAKGGRGTAHIAATMVYLTFPVPELPDPHRTVDACLQRLPHAVACHTHLKELCILNDTTIGPELSHLIASTMEAARIKYSQRQQQLYTTAKAIEYYKDAYLGYLSAWKRLHLVRGFTWQRIVLSTFEDYAWECFSGYVPSRHLDDYERFGGSAPWRCISTLAKLGSLVSTEGRHDEATKLLEQAAQLSSQVFGSSHEDTIAIDILVMQAYMRQENFRAAYDVACRKAWAFMNPEPAVMDDDDGRAIKMGLCDTEIGAEMARDIGFYCLEIAGMENRAIQMFQCELKAKKHVWGDTSGRCCGAMQRLARAYEQAGDVPASIYWQGEALDIAIQDSELDIEDDFEEKATEVEEADDVGKGTGTQENADSGEPVRELPAEKKIIYGKGLLRTLDDGTVRTIIARFRELRSRVVVFDAEMEDLADLIDSWERYAQVWELQRSLSETPNDPHL